MMIRRLFVAALVLSSVAALSVPAGAACEPTGWYGFICSGPVVTDQTP